MNRRVAETKQEVRSLYLNWPERRQQNPGKSMLFQAYLRQQNGFSYMQFGREGMHQAVTSWVDEWDRFYN